MNLKSKLTVLDQIYEIYDDFIRTQDLACKKYCSVCCTPNVTLTTLEGYKIVDYLIANKKHDLFRKLSRAIPTNRFKPPITTNRIAQLCAKGKDLPAADASPYPGVCPLLIGRTCPVYEVRPFGCRCLVSRQPCDIKGYAEINDFVLSVNTLFLQVIEHVDSQGQSGNLTDVLLYLESDDKHFSTPKTNLNVVKNNLIPNQTLDVLMIAPEHRDQIKPILLSLQSITI